MTLKNTQEVDAAPHAAAIERSIRQTMMAMAEEAADGLRAVTGSPALRAIALIQALVALSLALFGTSYMIYVSRDLAIPTGWLGMIFALGGLGSVLGASIAPRMARRWGPGWTMTAGLAAYALGAAFVPLAQPLGGLWVGVALLIAQQIVSDAGHSMHDVHDRTLRQTAVPRELLARVDAGVRTAGQLATLIGALCGGLIGNAFGARAVLWIAVVAASGAVAVALSRLAQRSDVAGRSGEY